MAGKARRAQFKANRKAAKAKVKSKATGGKRKLTASQLGSIYSGVSNAPLPD